MVNPLFPLPAELGFVSEQEEARTTAGAAANLGGLAVLLVELWICMDLFGTCIDMGRICCRSFLKSLEVTFPYHGWDERYIYLLIYHTNQPFM